MEAVRSIRIVAEERHKHILKRQRISYYEILRLYDMIVSLIEENIERYPLLYVCRININTYGVNIRNGDYCGRVRSV